MLSLIIPAFNEQDQIVKTIEKAKSVLADAKLKPFEIIVVDDGSSDATGSRAKDAGARVVTHIQNLGYGHSLKDGIAASRHDMIVITDADGTYPLSEIPALVKEYQRGFDMVVGARTGRHYRESFIKSPMRKLLKWLVEFTAGRSIPDINSGLRVFSRKTIMSYYNQLCDTFSFTTAATLSYMMTGRTVAYLPIPYNERTGTSKVHLFRDSLRTLQYIIEAIIYYNPLKIFVACSALCLLLGLASIPFAISFKIATLFVFSVGTILAAILIFAIGLLAVLLKQIMNVGYPATREAPLTDRRSK